MFCSGDGFLSVAQLVFSETGYPAFYRWETKSQGNEVILFSYYHSNLIRTTQLLIEFLLSKFKTKNHLSYVITFITRHIHNCTWDQQSINSSKPVECLTITITIAMFLSLYYVQVSIPLHYRTSQNQSQLSQFKTFQIPNAKWTPVLINKIWYYKMHQESSQIVSEQIQLCISDTQGLLANHLFQCCSKHQVMFFKSCPEPN